MRPRLREGEVHIWHAALQSAEPGARMSQLEADERERAERFRSHNDAVRFAISRVALRRILGGYLDADPRTLRFLYGANRKPALAKPYAGALKFNMSRSKDLALYAVALETQVGIDVEHIGADLEVDHLAGLFFSPFESASIRHLSADQRSRAFLNYHVAALVAEANRPTIRHFRLSVI